MFEVRKKKTYFHILAKQGHHTLSPFGVIFFYKILNLYTIEYYILLGTLMQKLEANKGSPSNMMKRSEQRIH